LAPSRQKAPIATKKGGPFSPPLDLRNMKTL
jgi:hypothetical protein